MGTYFKGESKLSIAATIDIGDWDRVIPLASPTGTYTIYTCPAGRFALYQVFGSKFPGTGGITMSMAAKSKAHEYSGDKTLIKTIFATFPGYNPAAYDAQTVTHQGVTGIDFYAYLRTIDSLLSQASANAYCALLGPGDAIEAVIGAGWDSAHAMDLRHRKIEFEL